MSENQSGFVALPHFILQNPDLTPESIILYANLLHFDRKGGRGCFAKRSTISKFSNMSLHKLRNAIKVLEDNGIITVCRRRNHLTDVIKITPDCRPPIKEAARRPARSSARSSNVSDLQTSLTAHSPAPARKPSSSDIRDCHNAVSNSLISSSSKDITQEETNKICNTTAPEGVGQQATAPEPNPQYQQATDELLGHLKTKLGPRSLDAWFTDSWIEKATDTEVIFRTGKGRYVADWLSNNYLGHIRDFTGKAVTVIS